MICRNAGEVMVYQNCRRSDSSGYHYYHRNQQTLRLPNNARNNHYTRQSYLTAASYRLLDETLHPLGRKRTGA